jgi:hypothetical protein
VRASNSRSLFSSLRTSGSIEDQGEIRAVETALAFIWVKYLSLRQLKEKSTVQAVQRRLFQTITGDRHHDLTCAVFPDE